VSDQNLIRNSDWFAKPRVIALACIVPSFTTRNREVVYKKKRKQNIVRSRAYKRTHTHANRRALAKLRNRFAAAVAECADRINLFLEQRGR